nr:retrovirus-related Pol polyprotein from transposon TNT 1-94 [Tanacetum cinerariifolium]
MLNKENYMPWSSRLLRYAKSRPNGKLIHNSIINGPYTDDELTEKELKQIKADYQAIQTILLGLPEDIYALVDSCETAKEIWLRVQQMMKGFDIGIQEKKAKNKHFGEKIASNLKFLNNLQPEWSRHVTIVHQTKDLHPADYTQLYDFLKYNQKDVDELKAERLAKTQDPLALLANSNNHYAFPAPHQDGRESEWVQRYTECQGIWLLIIQEFRMLEIRMGAQLGDLKGKSKDTSYVSDTFNPLSQKLENENVELEFQVINYARENAHLKTTYKNLFNSISVSRTQTKTIIVYLQKELQNTIYENAKLRARLLKKEEKHMPNNVRASARTKPITVSQPPVKTKKDVNSDSNGLSSTGIDNTKTKRPQPRSNTKNDRVPSASKSSQSKNKEVEVEEHHRNLLLSKNSKHMLSACNNFKLESQNVYSKPKVKKPKKVEFIDRLATPKPSKPRSFLRWSPTGRMFDLNGKIIVSSESKSHSDCSKVIQICFWCVDSGCSKHMTRNLKLLINFVWKFMGTVRFENDHVAAIMGFGDLQWGNILITRVYFVKGLGHNLFFVRQFCDSDLEVAFRRNACFIRNLEGVDLLKGDRSTNLYTINLHEIASASLICLMAHASSTKSWLWHQRLSHLNFDTINDLARNDLVSVRTPQQNRVVERRNRTLVEAARTMLIFSRALLFLWAEAIATACFTQNRSIIHHRFNKTPSELINGRKQDISFLHVFGAICYPKNDRKDIRKLGAKRDIGFFIGYSVDSCAYRIFNRRTKKIMETMNVSFDELLAMAFEQRSSKPELQSMTSGQITAARTVMPGQEPQVRQTSTASTSIADSEPTPTNSSSLATNVPNSSQDVDELNLQQQHAQQ